MRVYKRTKRKKRERYFTQETEDAIVKYNNSTKQSERDRIFSENIYYAFDKIAENLIHTYKFYYLTSDTSFEDVKHEVIAFLLEKIHKYAPEKGKAFSYFNQVALNYLIVNNKLKYRDIQSSRELDLIDSERSVVNEELRKDYQEELNDFFNYFIEHVWDRLSLYFDTEREIRIVDCLFELMDERENIENFNKKAIYINIREMAGVKTEHITPVVNKLQEIYKDLFRYYKEHGDLNISGSFW